MKQKSIEELIRSMQGTEAERTLALRSIYANAELRDKVENWVLGHGGSREEAQENFQDALVIFDRNVRSNKYEGTGTWEGYFFGIARFCWFERRRRLKPATTELLPVHLDKKAESFEVQFMEEERKEVLRQALENMGGRCKEILTLYKSGISYQEMAEHLGMSSAEMAKKECYRCRQRFREYLLQRPDLLKYLKDDSTDD
ncbi:MAG: sigma-70 family RNA polymerase sigma factor [Saprospiraceae bacterium]|nr:sigma-70 family RNA polymerase sigma factor [Saprospiraceae bacterium]